MSMTVIRCSRLNSTEFKILCCSIFLVLLQIIQVQGVTVTGGNMWECVDINWSTPADVAEGMVYYRWKCTNRGGWNSQFSQGRFAKYVCGYTPNTEVTCEVIAVGPGGISSSIDGTGRTRCQGPTFTLRNDFSVNRRPPMYKTYGGNDCVLKKRLKLFYKTRLMDQQGLSNVHKADIDYILVINFEATCEDDQNDFPHEIIEFPVVVVSVSEKRVVDQYHSYVRPVRRPVLTPFCKNLTGITQAQVDGSPLFTTVLVDMWKWVLEHNYRRRMAILTDGPWDMLRFMYLQCIHSKIDFPKWARKWINIRKLFINFYGTQRLNLAGMLEAIGETFQGHPHAGIDDSINIARIAIC